MIDCGLITVGLTDIFHGYFANPEVSLQLYEYLCSNPEVYR